MYVLSRSPLVVDNDMPLTSDAWLITACTSSGFSDVTVTRYPAFVGHTAGTLKTRDCKTRDLKSMESVTKHKCSNNGQRSFRR